MHRIRQNPILPVRHEIVIFSPYEGYPVPFERTLWKNAKGREEKWNYKRQSSPCWHCWWRQW